MAAWTQEPRFPRDWTGTWKGDLTWYSGAGREPQKVPMELRIQPTDSSHRYSWQLVYGGPGRESRDYLLIARDTAKGHWVIDERNGIVLDQYWMAGRLTCAFTVMQSTIINSYWMQDNDLHAEFHTISAKPVATTGMGNEESPKVESYQVRGYQKAVLRRE